MSERTIPYEDVGGYIGRMWESLGIRLEKLAHERAASATSHIDAKIATDIAKFAEGCLWQSMGDGDAFDLERPTKAAP